MKIVFGKNKDKEDLSILTEKLNQHGLICGATGTGKTVTLKVLAEAFSELGIPVVLADVKGDLSNLSKAGVMDNLEDRVEELEISMDFSSFPVELWDVYGKEGLPLRVSLSELGPLLLSQILGLNDTQEGVINIAFRISDSEGMLLLDLKDLKSVLRYIDENKKEVSKEYGNVTSQSISAILRKVLLLEDQGGDFFFNEPSLSITDLIREKDGKGIINILTSKKLVNNPTMYSIFLLWLLSELYEELEEVGNREFPNLVFFFDESHLLFNNGSRVLLEKVLQVVKLIRSKGVGIFFVTQNPIDIPDEVSSQLGTKIIHQLRAFSPREIRTIKEISQGLRQNDSFNLEDEIQNLRTGEAIFSTLDESGSPTPVVKGLIYPPKSSFVPLTLDESKEIVNSSYLREKYMDSLDRESAYELLAKRFDEEASIVKAEELKKIEEKTKSPRDNMIGKMISSAVYSFSRQVGRDIARGVLGSIKKTFR